MTAVTVPGGNGTPFNLNFNTTDNTAFQNTLLSSFAATFASTNLYTSLNPSTPSSNPTVPNIFVVSPTLNAFQPDGPEHLRRQPDPERLHHRRHDHPGPRFQRCFQ